MNGTRAEGKAAAVAGNVVKLPRRQRGFGLISAARVSSAAYRASWVDAMPVLQARVLVLTQANVKSLHITINDQMHRQACLQEFESARVLLVDEGFAQITTWNNFLAGARPN
jgi:hypothetical protein